MAAHSSILAWKIPWTEEPGGYCPWGHKRVRHDLETNISTTWLSVIGHWVMRLRSHRTQGNITGKSGKE